MLTLPLEIPRAAGESAWGLDVVPSRLDDDLWDLLILHHLLLVIYGIAQASLSLLLTYSRACVLPF